MAKTMNVAWMPEHIPLRNEVLTSISRAALAAKPRAGMTQAEKEKAVRQKLLNMSAHLVRTKAHLRSLSVHFDSWRRLATSRALQQASLGLKELKEKAFFIWSLSVRKKRQVCCDGGREGKKRAFGGSGKGKDPKSGVQVEEKVSK
uniref:Uncharacterized protein n=1 Tax=Chromera velia CCMP2878 TaxID=1169474 RepID=A0A0G4HBG1_9ALVE|eukprot:Cvel_25944.t1-p1 / transcript=Cvel_25944.t1 / gene=Cvel_25944 / organism=Chromera_velia_CCMP2878 / gene_product=hypothetical protein / transcript_product=hypothetical protein / location=Cvel_scaffold3005:17383-20796(-) / protein_length=145 / sequence_SO=supercontig / SO=protein_coding / is_pseudo=false